MKNDYDVEQLARSLIPDREGQDRIPPSLHGAMPGIVFRGEKSSVNLPLGSTSLTAI